MSQIKTKSFNYGDEKEANWPPMYPENPKGVVGYWDRETQTFKEGYPPNPNNHFGDAPIVMFDSMPPQYHEGQCRTIESRKEWEAANKEHGMISFSSHDEVKRHTKKGVKAEEKEQKKDRRKALRASLESWRSKPREMRQKLDKKGDAQIEAAKKAGIDLTKAGINLKD